MTSSIDVRDLAWRITEYEEGRLEDEEVDALFQYLINTGLAWTFQGSYGRAAVDLIRSGRCHLPQIQTGGAG